MAQLKYQEQSADVLLLVVEGSGPSLFGKDWLSRVRLDWTKICNIRVSETNLPQGVASQLRTTVQNHPNVFKPDLGTVKGITAKLKMKPDARPKFCKARLVPLCSAGSCWSWIQPSRVRRNCRTGGIQWMGYPNGSCPQGRWNYTFLWWLCRYCQPPASRPSVSNSPPGRCILKTAGWTTFH